MNYALSTDEAMCDLDQYAGLDVPGFSIETEGERSSSPGSDRSPGLEFDQDSDVQEHDGGVRYFRHCLHASH